MPPFAMCTVYRIGQPDKEQMRDNRLFYERKKKTLVKEGGDTLS
jgi:hypothetical protein